MQQGAVDALSSFFHHDPSETHVRANSTGLDVGDVMVPKGAAPAHRKHIKASDFVAGAVPIQKVLTTGETHDRCVSFLYLFL